MEQKPLDLEVHEGETAWSVWKRRLLFGLLIVLCVTFAAPVVGNCSGALGSGGSKVWGTFTVGDRKVVVHESDFVVAHERYSAVLRMFDPTGQRSSSFRNDDVWAQLILDEVAKQGGVHVPDADVARIVREHPAFQTNGQFDERRYRDEMRQLRKYARVDEAGFTAALRSFLRTETWKSVWASAYAVPQSREAWQEWSRRNVKVSVDYVVQPYAPLVAKAADSPVTDEDRRRAKVLPSVAALVTLPARRSYEAAWVRIHEVTDAQRAAMAKFADDTAIVPKDETLESVAWRQFFANHKDGPYTRTTWLTLRRAEYEAKLAEWQSRPEPRPEAEKPKDPATEEWPEKPAEQFYRHWRPFVEADVLTAAVLRHMAARSERESKSFADLAADYAPFGVRVTATTQPLADDEIDSGFPEGLGKDSELGSSLRAGLTPPAAGAAFSPKVLLEPIQTCRVTERVRDRGWLVVRCTAYEAPREREDAEIRAKVDVLVREHRATELARDVLVDLRKKVEAVEGPASARGETLRKLAAEAGLEVRTIRRFNSLTGKATPPEAADDPAAAAAALKVRQRGRVQDEYAFLSKLEPGQFRDPVILDDACGGAFLILVTEKVEPGPLEIDDATLRSERYLRSLQSQQSMREQFSPKELKSRYALELTPEGRKATEKGDDEK